VVGDVVTPRDQAYLDLLHLGLVLLRNFSYTGRVALWRIESDHLHEIPTLIGESNEHRHVYYITGERGLYLQRLRELGAADYLEDVGILYAELWRVLASAAGVELSE
jgi:hypothetical protein